MSNHDLESKGSVSEISGNDTENCCSNTSIYQITYNHIAKTWLICNDCLELDFFKTGIENKVRIQR